MYKQDLALNNCYVEEFATSDPCNLNMDLQLTKMFLTIKLCTHAKLNFLK